MHVVAVEAQEVEHSRDQAAGAVVSKLQHSMIEQQPINTLDEGPSNQLKISIDMQRGSWQQCLTRNGFTGGNR